MLYVLYLKINLKIIEWYNYNYNNQYNKNFNGSWFWTWDPRSWNLLLFHWATIIRFFIIVIRLIFGIYSLNFLFDKSNKSNAKQKILKNVYFFKNKILHRDLKWANVFLNKDGTVKLGDLNVSKVAKMRLVFTQTGTPYYASPESQNSILDPFYTYF